MARASARSAPPRETVPLNSGVLKGLLAVALLAVVVVALWRFDAHNERIQMRRRLTDHPVLGTWHTDMCAQIERGAVGVGPRAGRTPEALWVGQISRRELGNPSDRAPILLGVTLAPAQLLAGQLSAKDGRGRAVSISVKDFVFPQGQPQIGERWAFAVYRINDGHSVAYDARLVP